MAISSILAAFGAVFGLIGSLVLAFAVDPALKMLRAHLNAHDRTLEALVGSANVPVFTGFDKQHTTAFNSATRRVKAGGLALAIAFVLQLVSILTT